MLPPLCCQFQSQLCHLGAEPGAAAGADKTRNNAETVETLNLHPAAACTGSGAGMESAWIQVVACIVWVLVTGCRGVGSVLVPSSAVPEHSWCWWHRHSEGSVGLTRGSCLSVPGQAWLSLEVQPRPVGRVLNRP